MFLKAVKIPEGSPPDDSSQDVSSPDDGSSDNSSSDLFILFYFIIYKIDKEYYEFKTTQNPRSMDLSHCSKRLILIMEAPFLFWFAKVQIEFLKR